MSGTAITIVSADGNALTDAAVMQAANLVKTLGVEGIRISALNPGKAVDILVDANSAELTSKIYQKLQNLGSFDIFVQKNDENRRKRLLIADMDATIIVGETLDELADHLGLKDQIAPITAKAMQGEIDFAEALAMRVKLLAGMPLSDIFKTIQGIVYSGGAKTLVATMNRFGGKCVLVSGGFDFFTRHVGDSVGFYKNFGNTLGVNDDKLTGEVLPPIVDKHAKKIKLEEEAKLLQIPLSQTMAVGDGANDIPMLQTAGAGVGYFAKPAVVIATPYQVRHTDLTALLYMQGYSKQEISFS